MMHHQWLGYTMMIMIRVHILLIFKHMQILVYMETPNIINYANMLKCFLV